MIACIVNLVRLFFLVEKNLFFLRILPSCLYTLSFLVTRSLLHLADFRLTMAWRSKFQFYFHFLLHIIFCRKFILSE